MPFLWILFAVLVLLLAAGFAGFQFACVKRCLPPEPLTEDYIRRSSFAKWTDSLFFGAEWFRLQKPETLHVVSYDGKLLSARFLPCDNARGTILLFHGYRSSALLDFGLEVEFLHKQGYNLLLCDQRAHGASQGRFLTFGVRERYDVLSWVTYLAQRLGQEHPMYLSGMSMGATTVLMASCFEFPANVCGIVADCGFTSPWDVMKSVALQMASRRTAPAGAERVFHPPRRLLPARMQHDRRRRRRKVSDPVHPWQGGRFCPHAHVAGGV